MMVSEEKITSVMDFLVNKLGWESSLVARAPGIMSTSLKKAIVPRCAVYQVLLSEGLIKNNDVSLMALLWSSEKCFLKRFVNCHEE